MVAKIKRGILNYLKELFRFGILVAMTGAMHLFAQWMETPLWLEITLISSLVAERYVFLDNKDKEKNGKV